MHIAVRGPTFYALAFESPKTVKTMSCDLKESTPPPLRPSGEVGRHKKALARVSGFFCLEVSYTI